MVEQKLLGKGGNDMKKIKINLYFEKDDVLTIRNEMSDEKIEVDTESKTIKAKDLVKLFDWKPNTEFEIDTSNIEEKNKHKDSYRLYKYVLELLNEIQEELNKLSKEIHEKN